MSCFAFGGCLFLAALSVFSVCFVVFVFPVASPPGGHDPVAYPSCHGLVFVVYFILWFSLAIRTRYYLSGCFFTLLYFSFLPLLVFRFSLFRCINGVRILCLSIPVRCHGIAFFYSLYCITHVPGYESLTVILIINIIFAIRQLTA